MKNNKIDKVYFIVFLILEFIIIFIFEYLSISDIKIFIFTQVTFVILFSLVYFVIMLFIEKFTSRKFCIEYNKIMREYQKIDDAEVFYNNLKRIKGTPVGKDIQNTYFLSLATASYKTGKKEEALKYLDMIKTEDKHILKVIEDERKAIVGESK